MKKRFKHNCLLYSFFCAFYFPSFLFSQSIRDSSKNFKYLIVPIVFKTPETGWAGGLSGSISFNTTPKSRNITRTSVIQVLSVFTERKQNVQAIDATIYLPKENYILSEQLSHSQFPENFWGIGPNTKNSFEERYTFEQVSATTHLKRKIFRRFFIGGILDFQTVYKIKSFNNGGIFDTTVFNGKTNNHILGLGLSASFDTRNNSFWPNKGMFLQTSITAFHKELFSSYTFQRFIIDFRFYKATFKNHVIAIQLYNYSTTGNTPLRNLGMLGGANNLRGYYQGRFRDKSLYSVIAEYRAFIYWRISGCVFGGFGDVYSGDNRVSLKNVKASFGGGLRLALLAKEKLNLRLDYGYVNKYNKGFYFTVAESF